MIPKVLTRLLIGNRLIVAVISPNPVQAILLEDVIHRSHNNLSIKNAFEATPFILHLLASSIRYVEFDSRPYPLIFNINGIAKQIIEQLYLTLSTDEARKLILSLYMLANSSTWGPNGELLPGVQILPPQIDETHGRN